MNIANWLTVSRVLLLPLAVLPVILGWSEGWLMAASVTFLAGLSDFVDGRLARRLKLANPLGANLDFLSDKIFVGGMLIALTAFGVLPVWIPLVVLAREALISVLRINRLHSRPLASDIWGKSKTAVSFLAIGWAAFNESIKSGGFLAGFDGGGHLSTILSLAPWAMLAAVALTLISGFNYVWKCAGPADRRS